MVRRVYGENISTSRIMENDSLFTNIPENTKHRKQEEQFLYKLAARTSSKSLMITPVGTNKSAQRLIADQLPMGTKLQRDWFTR
ncbi:hypothetical protein AVEN_34941-1 [Araneus ventricosus]|uniref:Uncharacterized protein n=1 Tax=Araneus ventricosus TaxID=182803 RepID=A0A4Y2G9V4_ARAVE|nr:hypothetical protein AVEN_34941-1 [Araneus ventricosus]